MNKFECSELGGTLQPLTHLDELVVKRDVGLFPLLFFKDRKLYSCILRQTLFGFSYWRCVVRVEGQTMFFSIRLSNTYMTLIEYVI